MDISLASIGKLIHQYKTPKNAPIDEWDFYVKLAGDHRAAFVLRRVIYWTANKTAIANDGWFYKTHQQMSRETAGLSKYHIKKAQKQLQKLVLIKHEQKDGKTFTWYKLKKHALLKAIGALISRYTGKSIDIGRKKTDSLRQRFSRTGLKNLTHQSDTSYSNNQTHDNHIQTSINQDANEKPATTPPAQPIDDDLKLNLPDWLKDFSFNGECDVAEFIKQIERIGEAQAKKKFQETSKVGKSWQYHLNSLINEPSATTSSEPRKKETDGQWIPGKYADIINKPAKAEPAPAPQEPESIPMYWQAIRQQFELQFNSFELSGSRCRIEGKKAIIILTSDHHRRNIENSDKHPRGISYWIKSELAKLATNNQPEIMYTVGG